MKKTILLFPLFICLLLVSTINAQTVLNSGDVMITGINAGNGDIAFVTWVDLQPGTKIYFTNNGWNSAAASTATGNGRNKEEIATWTNSTSGIIRAGSAIVTKTADTYTASVGTTTVFSNAGAANPALRIQDGDQITIYQPESGNGYSANNADAATFKGKVISIAAWLYNFVSSGTIDDTKTYLPSDLVSYSVFHSTGFLNPYIHYKGVRTGLAIDAYKTLLLNSSQWQNDWALPLSTTSFAPGSLPVKLIKFTAAFASANVSLRWTTAAELNLLKYEVEYSSNAVDFNKVGEVSAEANTGNNEYAFKHIPADGAICYYRLKMVDHDGAFSYSPVERVQKTSLNISMSLKPNPVVDQRLSVSANNLPRNSYALIISNNAGVMVYKQNINHSGGEMVLPVQLPSLAQGIYHVQLLGSDIKLRSTFMVK